MSENPLYTRRGLLPLVAGVAVVIFVAATILFALTRGDEDDPGADKPAATSTPDPETDGSVCGLERETSQEVPTRAPEVDWYLNGKIATPESDRYGPGEVEDGIHSCFSSGPYGALLAAVNVATDNVNPDVTSDDVVRTRLVPNAASRRLIGQEVRKSGPFPQVAGFAFDNFAAGESATLRIALEGPNGYFSTSHSMVWRKGDWYASVADTDSGAVQLRSLDGFIEWSGL